MKQLYIIRHAKSSWDFLDLSDDERPLKKRGKNDSKIMGEVLQHEGISPQLIISSHANRAHSTAKIIARYLGYKKKNIAINQQLYFEGVSGIIEVIKNTPDEIDNLMIFGHNPDFTSLVATLTGEAFPHLPTCGAVGVSFDISSWKDLQPGAGNQQFFHTPKMFK